jgi:TorA maturation chaperone TorD
MNAVLKPIETDQRSDVLARFRTAVAGDLLFLALLHDRELDRGGILALWEDCYEDFLGLMLRGERGRQALSLFREGLTDIPTALGDRTLDMLAAEYADIYLNHGFGASPCESVWLDDDHLTMQEPMFQIRTWYARYGLAVEDWRKRTDDHLVNQLRFLAHLHDPATGDQGLADAARFMDEHLLRWIDDFAARVANRASMRLYAGLAALTAAYLGELREMLAAVAEVPIPSPEEIEERMKPKVAVAVDPPSPYVPGVAPSW